MLAYFLYKNPKNKWTQKFKELIYEDENGNVKSGVCLLCDRMSYVNKIRWLKETKLKELKRLFAPIIKIKEEVLKCYVCTGEAMKRV